MKKHGNCFEAAWCYLNCAIEETSPSSSVATVLLVHGEVFSSKWLVHAWVERDQKVIDPSNSNPSGFSWPVGVYYALMQVRNVVKYTPSDALFAYLNSCPSAAFDSEAVQTSHGPWDPRLLEAIEREDETVSEYRRATGL
jgi:hypothetical protein